jgi:Ni,Fe-hydrogenase I large subunit
MATTPRTVAAPLEVEVDPISRIEGHLGVKVTIGADGFITDAKAHGNLWRGFENFLLGRDINDAITYTQRICGVCPVPHGTASMFAADAVLGYSKGHITFKYDGTHGVPEKALLIRNLVLSAEFLMSSITHFYHLAAPSYVQGPAMPPWTPYFNDEYYATQLRSMGAAVPDTSSETQKLWDAVILSYVKALKIRRKTFEAGALFAGRMPMTSCFVAGGVSNDGTEDLTARCQEFEALIREVGLFIVNEYVPIALALGALYPGFDNGHNDASNTDPDQRGYGAGLGRFLSWGMLPNLDDTLTFPGGVAGPDVTPFTVVDKAEVASKFLSGANSVPTNLTEDISNSRYEAYADDAAVYATTASRPYASATSSYPGDVTRTKPVRANGYTYMKGPRWQGKPCEVGPLARLVVAGIYPVNGGLLSAIPGYKEIYTVDGAGGGGLDTRVIASEIANGLTNEDGTGVFLGVVAGYILGLKGGLSTMDRLRARAIESLVLVQKMVGSVSKNVTTGELSFGNNGWIHQLMARTGDNVKDAAGSTWRTKALPVGTVQNWGATEAPRGALMHQAKITNGKIAAYQCIVPTTWNGSPRDAGGHGAIEAAVMGAPFSADTKVITSANGVDSITTEGGVEVLRIAQSFDPCIACAVH